MRAIRSRRHGGASVLRILMGVGFLAVLIGYTIFHANFVLGRSLLFAFPDWQVTYRSGWPLLSGGATARDVTLISPAGAEGGKFHFASLRISVPFFEYYRSGFSRERGSLLNSIRNLNLEFDDGHGNLNYPFTRELDLFGAVSAAPFEAEGCLEDSVWLESELGEMGLSTRGTQLVMAYHLENGRLIKEQTIHTPGVGRVDFRRELIKHDNFSLFSLIESGRSEVAADEWHVKDEGFVAARNRHCASKDKIGADEFVMRHVRSAKRLLEAQGLAPQQELEDAYRNYANAGGSFDLAVRYDPPIGGQVYGAADMSAWLPSLHGKFAVNGKAYPLALTAVAARPLPESENAVTTYELIQRENAATADADSPKAIAPAQAESIAKNPQRSSVASATPMEVAADSTKSSTAAPAPSPAQINHPPASAAVSAEEGDITSYKQLASFVGHRLTIYQQGHGPMRVEIVRVVGAGDILVRRQVQGGNVEYVLARNGFDHAQE